MRLLQEGDVIELTEGHTVYMMVPQCLVYANKPDSWALVHHEVSISGTFSFLARRYIVYKAYGDDGHHVHCEAIDYPALRIDFYQSGSYTAMIKDIAPIGNAVRQWQWSGDTPK